MPPHRRIDIVLGSVKRLQRIGATANLLNLLQKQHPADLADVFSQLPDRDRNATFKVLVDQNRRLAMEALNRKEEAAARALQTTQQAQTQNQMVANLQSNVNDLKSKVASYENDLVMLKARARTANATRKINQRLSNVDTKGTVALLERMKEKVAEEEALSQAYGEMADSGRSIDDEIDKALVSGSPSKAADSLSELKSKMGIS